MTSKYAIQLILQASTELYIHAWLHNKRRDPYLSQLLSWTIIGLQVDLYVSQTYRVDC